MPKHLTNVQLVKHMMEFSQYGALAQLFILDAIEKCATRVSNTDPAALREAFGKDSFINPDAWQGVAKEILKQIEERR